MRRRSCIMLMVLTLALAACANDEAEDADDAAAEPAADASDSDSGEEVGAREGYFAASSHEELVEAAEQESGTFTAWMSHDQEVVDQVMASFMEKYDFVDAVGTEVGDADERILLELQGEAHDSDIVHMEEDHGIENYYPHLEKIDFLAMSEAGVLDIAADMINPEQPEAVAVGTTMGGISYNEDLLPEHLIPETHEDLLDPELQGSGLLWADVAQSVNLAALNVVWGEEGVIEYAEAIRDQEPIWTSNNTRSVTAMAAGEFAVGVVNHYHSPLRVQEDAPHIQVVLAEPIPVRLTQQLGVNGATEMPATAILFMEHVAGLEVQELFNEAGPMQGSIFVEGSATAELTDGKEIAFVGWEDMAALEELQQRIFGAWGFPTPVFDD